ncbi:RagB/SusD family nutrient uptake outer membrane protein [Sphingobacterium oryzagri]|uniref:RagB/SusD family nutrient uptake outer membrane protein n=1 Tax=Sphingobacterium oryzagri TaxID=3025669 RepID=A0ABY7WBU0_9SPHI|nr:RagB/SusD family nutrient uptake outer membrane protein [Sphingobacterium sp. KACC 22765]WDF66932.1 RagB/SusD family nutrient uptake outer membrane protein [Sphingobacterium sp. KACC 22765]
MKYLQLLYSVMFLGLFSGCTAFLDAKPEDTLATPTKLQDLQGMLDYESSLNMNYPSSGDIAADYFFLTSEDWQGFEVDPRNTYTWDADAQNLLEWTYAHRRIFQSNVVLDAVDAAELNGRSESDRRDVRGQALFFRAFTFFQLAQVYCPYYHVGMEDSPYGLPLKLSSDINEPLFRSTVQQTYQRIIADLELAADLLPEKGLLPVRPSRLAAYGALARVSLVIEDYDNALKYADAYLEINDELLDYNTLDGRSTMPIAVFNKEVAFHAVTLGNSSMHEPTYAFVDSLLAKSYEENDLRRSIFLLKDPSGYFRFKGSYDGTNNVPFAGLATDEVYLLRAETLARLGRNAEATETMNTLLRFRYKTGQFIPWQNIDSEVLLAKILEERQKELLFRGGIRWSDLRRLNRDPRFAKKLIRRLGAQLFELEPLDIRYTFLLPWTVLEMNGLPQNPR